MAGFEPDPTGRFCPILDKRVVVLPFLYRDCQIPGFLRDKIYVDFRHGDDYEHGVHQIVQRVSDDRKNDPSFREAEELLDSIQLTSLWKTALRVRKLTPRFGDTLEGALVQISTGEWDPPIAISYIAFLGELSKQEGPSHDSWSLLCRIVENDAIKEWLRFVTLCQVSEMTPSIVGAGRAQLPKLFTPEGEETAVIHMCVEGLFDPVEARGITPDIGAYPRILATLWAYMPPVQRRYLLRALDGCIRARASKHTHVLKPLQTHLEDPLGAPVDTVFYDIREAWTTAKSLPADIANKNTAALLIKTALSKRGALRDCSELLHLFREASSLEERRDFSLYVLVLELAKREQIAVLRELQGDEIAFELLVGVATDPEVEVCLSIMSLICLVMAFGGSALAVDDRFPMTLLDVKRRGQAKISVMQALCEMALSNKGQSDGISVT